MSLQRYAAKRDLAEPAIVAALERIGCFVERLSSHGMPDLLVGYRGVFRLLEVKTGKRKARGTQAATITALQRMNLPVYVVRSVDDALQAIGAVR